MTTIRDTRGLPTSEAIQVMHDCAMSDYGSVEPPISREEARAILRTWVRNDSSGEVVAAIASLGAERALDQYLESLAEIHENEYAETEDAS